MIIICLPFFTCQAAQPAGTGNSGSSQPPAGEGQPGNQPGGEAGTSYIQVTPEERQAIERVRDQNKLRQQNVFDVNHTNIPCVT